MHSPTPQEPLTIRVDGDFEACSAWWEDLQNGALASPYQGLSWTQSWWRHCESRNRGTLRIVSLFHGDAPLAIMPLVVERSLGMNVAYPVGSRHFNWQIPLWDSVGAARIGAAERNRLMQCIGAAIRADTIVYPNMPESWGGRENPFIAPQATPSPSATYRLDLHPDFEELARARRSKKSLSQLRRKRKRLEDATGPVQFHRAGDAASCREVLQAAIAQRAARKLAGGVPSFFDRPGGEAFVRELLEDGCRYGLRDAPMSAHYLTAGEHIVATYFGACLNGNYSCFINSFDGAFDSFSPGDIALHDVIADACAQGLTGFDLGVGDERYKQAWCDMIQLYESSEAITARGRIYDRALRFSRDGKRAFKQNRTLWEGWRAVRRVAARAFA
ncbi:MAG: GNAT family N-acetyltransferase [Salinarimonas sp.]|nr:GNAT family N-acetyltransferase [Salinarimonas sp.]